MADKKTLLVIFGGVSSEHDISRLSSASVLRHLDSDIYDVVKVGITREGKWFITEADPDNIENGSWENDASNREVCILTDFTGNILVDGSEKVKIDVAFPVLHGKNGEDGTIQGLLQLAGIPFVGSDTTASAVCMDKGIAKAVVDQADACDQAKYCIIHKGSDIEDSVDVIDDFFDAEYPLFVKPANAGSSVGITKVKAKDNLPEALRIAFAEDRKVLVEEAIVGREIEIAVLGNYGAVGEDAPKASCIGEVFAANEFYDFTAKYEDVGSRTGVVRDLSKEKEDEIRAVAVAIYEILGCSGLSRVDFFLEKGESGGYDDGRLVFNEINTLPGFTKISMYPQLWEASGISYSELINKLVNLALSDK